MHLRLIWETGEWDPVGLSLNPKDDDYWSVGSLDSDDDENSGDCDSYVNGGVFLNDEEDETCRGRRHHREHGDDDAAERGEEHGKYCGRHVYQQEEGEDDIEEDVDDHEDSAADASDVEEDNGKRQGKWVRREVELVDGTREVGHWIEGMEAKVRVEYREDVY